MFNWKVLEYVWVLIDSLMNSNNSSELFMTMPMSTHGYGREHDHRGTSAYRNGS